MTETDQIDNNGIIKKQKYKKSSAIELTEEQKKLKS